MSAPTTAQPDKGASLGRGLIDALEKVSGALSAIVGAGFVRESDILAFTGEWSHLGRSTYGELLDLADAALSKARASGAAHG